MFFLYGQSLCFHQTNIFHIGKGIRKISNSFLLHSTLMDQWHLFRQSHHQHHIVVIIHLALVKHRNHLNISKYAHALLFSSIVPNGHHISSLEGQNFPPCLVPINEYNGCPLSTLTSSPRWTYVEHFGEGSIYFGEYLQTWPFFYTRNIVQPTMLNIAMYLNPLSLYMIIVFPNIDGNNARLRKLFKEGALKYKQIVKL